ncbi:MAG: alpha-D-glucose phosphate-specific phosphoglucomutase [Xanthomonadales bacterium]|nr:alpha-D-glucose phosphate-specific phosphoglucomutase [Xanthomonadales bacterium]
MNIHQVHCQPFLDQRPGTAGLRKKVTVFQQPHYLECFVQSILDTLKLEKGASLVVGGDGRFFNREAIQTIIAIAAANGIGKLIIGKGGLLSTPAASNLIRVRNAAGGIILTASHNPGGPAGDFGIKFNTSSGGQAPEQMTDAVFERSQAINGYQTADIPIVNLDTLGRLELGELQIDIVDPVTEYAELMEELFDFELIRSALTKNIRLHYDALNAVTGPYARKIFVDMLQAPASSIHNATPLEDFGGLHPDPNPVDAGHLVDLAFTDNAPDLIAASDGDGDRNIILGRGMVVSPGDSLAIMLANTAVAPGYRTDVAGVARSMPTSRAVNMVADALNVPCYETPTGWRFFCNLLESGAITLCGEESFGTSSAHTREKDGLWAVLYWLNMMAALDQSVDEIVRKHWQRFGRCYFQRRDYFIPDADNGNAIIHYLSANIDALAEKSEFGSQIESADIFTYTDPVDGSISANQGVRIYCADGGRIVFRLSGTGTSGATLRVYLDRVEKDPAMLEMEISLAVGKLADMAANIARIEHFTGLTTPTAII